MAPVIRKLSEKWSCNDIISFLCYYKELRSYYGRGGNSIEPFKINSDRKRDTIAWRHQLDICGELSSVQLTHVCSGAGEAGAPLGCPWGGVAGVAASASSPCCWLSPHTFSGHSCPSRMSFLCVLWSAVHREPQRSPLLWREHSPALHHLVLCMTLSGKSPPALSGR